MKKSLCFLFVLFSCFTTLHARPNFEEIYPPVIQWLDSTAFFPGDRHGEFEGDPVAILTDGSAWKVHPTSREIFEHWGRGDKVRVKVRTDPYWFKREHKFALYNYDRGETIKVMLVYHKAEPLKIVSQDTYAKSKKLVAVASPYDKNKIIYEWQPADFRKILGLSDGTFWVIKENFNAFMIGKDIYIGAQGNPKAFYDFILIVGNQREAKWTAGRPQN